MDTSKNISIILTETDLSPQNINSTAKVIEHNPNKIFLLSTDGNLRLHQVIDNLNEVITKKSLLTKTRIAYNLKFDLKTVLKTGDNFSNDGVEVKTLADLLEYLDFDENLSIRRADYHVLIDDEGVDKTADNTDLASQAVAKLFQQTIFLNINLDIQKKSELKMAIMKDRFRKNYTALCTELARQHDFLSAAISHGNLNESGKNRVTEMLDAVKKTLDELAKARKRPIRIAAMGTKKAGKSVVINSLLRRDYAPTSSELPTPNTIKYIPSDPNSTLTLDYAGKKYSFAKGEDLNKFIDGEFQRARNQGGKGAALPNMTIYYPCDELNGYEVWDTPGPNFAGAGDEHRKNAEECIHEVDVCIFVMNYSSHLTDDEVEFLEQIREFFQKEGKFYSLFITVNRIDERYAAEVQKSVPRVLDYISGRLEQLNYKNIVVFGTSALQSFYLDKILSLSGGKDISQDTLRDLEEKYLDEDEKIITQIDFIGGAIEKLRRFHGIKNAGATELEAYSGMPQLRHYVKYVGESKADSEIVNKVVNSCEGQFGIIKSLLSIVEYQTLSDEAKKYLRAVTVRIDEVHNMARDFKSRIGDVISAGALRAAQKDAEKQTGYVKNTAIKEFKENVDLAVSRMTVTEQIIRDLADNSSNADFMNDLSVEVKNAFENIKKESTRNMEQFVKVTAYERKTQLETALNSATQEITEKVSDINKTLRKAGVPTIDLPTFPISISLNISNVNISGSVDSESIQDFAKDSIHAVERGGFFGSILDFFHTKTVVKVYEFKNAVSDRIKYNGNEKINSVFTDISRQVQNEIGKIFDNFIKGCDEASNTYQKIFSNTLYDINVVLDETGKKKAELDRNIAVLQNIDKNFQPFFKIWDNIRGENE